jgi:hypothetical protein
MTHFMAPKDNASPFETSIGRNPEIHDTQLQPTKNNQYNTGSTHTDADSTTGNVSRKPNIWLGCVASYSEGAGTSKVFYLKIE